MLLGITERLEFVDAPGHVEDLERYRARGYAMKGNRIAVVTDHPDDLVEVHPRSRGSVDLGGVTVERCPRCPPRPAMDGAGRALDLPLHPAGRVSWRHSKRPSAHTVIR